MKLRYRLLHGDKAVSEWRDDLRPNQVDRWRAQVAAELKVKAGQLSIAIDKGAPTQVDTGGDLLLMPKGALREWCRRHELAVSGSKGELAARIVDAGIGAPPDELLAKLATADAGR